MELGKHITKSLWGLADKALPVVYGIGYVYLVIRVLPEEEFGNFVLFQEIFLVLSGLTAAFALQPLLKFAAEDRDDTGGIISVSLILNFLSVSLAAAAFVILRDPVSAFLNAPTFAPLLIQLPALIAASFIRNFVLILLQSRFLISRVFWVDAIHFLGAPVLVWVYSRLHLFDSAMDLVVINIISLSASSLLALFFSVSFFPLLKKPLRGDFAKVWDYGVYSLGGVISYLLYSKADTFVLAAFTGPVAVAVYTSAKVFTRVFEMIAQVVQIFIFPAASRLGARGDFGEVKAMTEKGINFLTLAMIPIFIVFVGFASPLIRIIYQRKYADAVPILQVFAILALFIPLAEVTRNTLLGLGRVRAVFIIGVQSLMITLLLYLLLIPRLGAMGAALAFVLGGVLLAILGWRRLVQEIPIKPSEVLARTRDAMQFVRRRLSR